MRKCAWIVGTVLFLLCAIAIARADLIGDLNVNLHVDVYHHNDCGSGCQFLGQYRLVVSWGKRPIPGDRHRRLHRQRSTMAVFLHERKPG